jgi:hypothetical protein
MPTDVAPSVSTLSANQGIGESWIEFYELMTPAKAEES